MSLSEHLGELRRRLVVSSLAVSAGGVVAFIFYGSLLAFFLRPYCGMVGSHPCDLYVTSPLDGVSLRFKMAAYGGLMLALPVVLWQVWRFITPGLEKKERRYAVPFVLASMVVFGFGAFVAWITFPHALRWLGGIGGPHLQALYNPASYLSLILALMVVFGIALEVPVILVALEAAGVVKPEWLAARRRWAIVIITAFSAIGTPSSDPFSMLALAVPMYVFYEVSILIGKLLRR
ncbi:MAG TPA: twin-arginine translocase subunit TatC [Acidimicrobiales bacterium]|nr:twin-arginine translocase subunit TatC [Acidimicrobiales bacterium]